jgi:hypothetical protein
MSISKKDTIKRLNKRIKDRNYRFSKMTPAEKRVRIAKDVVVMLDEEKLHARTGSYLRFEDDSENSDVWDTVRNSPDSKQVHEILEPLESCTVCGIGAAFVATVLRADNLTLGDMTVDGCGSAQTGHLTNDQPMRKYLETFFTQQQLALIECAFEQDFGFRERLNGTCYKNVATKKDATKAARLGERYDEHDDRLRAIFNNIIANHGEFVPA